MFLGSFHFEDKGLDDYKPTVKVDFKSEKRKAELEKVLSLLEKFKPTKIAVEVRANRQEQLDADFKNYLVGEFELTNNEVHLLGFQLAKRLGHKSVFAVDAPRRRFEPYVDPLAFAKENGQEDLLDAQWMAIFEKQTVYEDKLKGRTSIGEYLQFLNRADRAVASLTFDNRIALSDAHTDKQLRQEFVFLAILNPDMARHILRVWKKEVQHLNGELDLCVVEPELFAIEWHVFARNWIEVERRLPRLRRMLINNAVADEFLEKVNRLSRKISSARIESEAMSKLQTECLESLDEIFLAFDDALLLRFQRIYQRKLRG